MSYSSLSATALADVSDRLKVYGSSLLGEHRDAIRALLEALEAGLTGNLSPHYHLSAIDPGIGKTLSVATFLRAWKEQGFTPSSSVLIGLSRLQEIEAYLKTAGLEREDIAVLTSKEEYNSLGVPSDQHGSAPVLFTTQQMIERRTRGRTFTEAREFHFHGHPRALRIWDESLVPAQQLSLEVDQVGEVLAALRSRPPQYAADVRALLRDLLSLENGERYVIQDSLSNGPPITRHLKGTSAAQAVETLARMAGQEVTAVRQVSGETSLIGVSEPLPADFPPVIILDASGRVRSTYRVWEAAGGPVRRLPSAVKDYSNLRVHLWERRVGKVAFQTPGAIEDVVRGVAETIEEHPSEDWLIVSYRGQPFEDLLRKALGALPPERLHFLTWGNHHGTNAFVHCKRVVLVGQLTYGTLGYLALAAACGASTDETDVELELKAGEYRHHLLQALTRASVRRSRNGLSGTCTAYVVSSPNVGARELLAEVFPDCMIERWSPDVPEVGGRAGDLIALMERARANRTRQLDKKELREALDLLPSNFSRLLSHPEVRLYMDAYGFRNGRSAIVAYGIFEPYEGEGFTIDELG